MGIVQSGVELKSFTVHVSVDHSLINTLIFDGGGTLPAGTLPLPDAAYTLPESVTVDAKSAASFNLEIDINALIGANIGKKVAIAVKIDSSEVEVDESLGTAVICIDTAFLKELV